MMPSRDFQNQCSLCETQMPWGILPMHRTLHWWIFSVVQGAEEFSAIIHKNKACKIRYQFGFFGLSRKFCVPQLTPNNRTNSTNVARTILEQRARPVAYTDNFYTTPRLAHYLLQNGTAFVDTVRPNRKSFSKALAPTSLQKERMILNFIMTYVTVVCSV